MSTVETRPTNGVSFGYVHTVTSQDDTDGAVTIDFQVDYDIVASVQVYDSSDVVVDTSDMVVDYPAAGQVRIQDGASTFALAADQRIDIVAQRRSS
jgi:hypothetical protein